ncbi:hypothetical protein, partial [Bradyrhizobium japonicum]|uniref:hypothetical protein n=1 Tax=Bradyrhizobium japonicum TaxID=375 RepID=UPI001BA69999
MNISIERAIVVGFWPHGQRMPNEWAFNFPSLRLSLTLPLQGLLDSHITSVVRVADHEVGTAFYGL